MAVSASEVMKLRQATGAGMMDCKRALVEAEGDFERAVSIIREKGKALANKRADREASEGCCLAGVSPDRTYGAIISLNSETDFVAKNETFVAKTESILQCALEHKPNSKSNLLKMTVEGTVIADLITELTGSIGEKIEVGNFEFLQSPFIGHYIHFDKKTATLIAFNQPCSEEVGSDIAMQVAAMNPQSVSKEDMPQEVLDEELRIAKEKARQEGKPEGMLDKIAQGRVNKFLQENTLLGQAFFKEEKNSVEKFLKNVEPNLTVTAFKRISLSM